MMIGMWQFIDQYCIEMIKLNLEKQQFIKESRSVHLLFRTTNLFTWIQTFEKSSIFEFYSSTNSSWHVKFTYDNDRRCPTLFVLFRY
jgi:hypothetical protein